MKSQSKGSVTRYEIPILIGGLGFMASNISLEVLVQYKLFKT